MSLLRALLLLQGALQCTNKWSQDAAAKFHHFAMVNWTTGGVGWLGLCFGSTTQRRRWPPSLPIAVMIGPALRRPQFVRDSTAVDVVGSDQRAVQEQKYRGAIAGH